MDYDHIKYDLTGRIGVVTLNRPDSRNVMNDQMIAELDDLLRKVETELDAKVLVIKGAGECFSIGQDLSGEGTAAIMAPPPGTPAPAKEILEEERRRSRRLEYIFNFPKPTIAQVHGQCIGLGCYLAMLCDIVIASHDAVFADPGLRMGCVSAMPLWTWLVGVKKAREIVYLGSDINAVEAERIGLINLAVPADKLEQEVHRYAKAISTCPGDGLALCKESINANLESRGVGTAWRFLDTIHLINQQQPFDPDEFNFFKVRDKKGLEEAMRERDKPFKDLGF
ncbi:MAG: enoyl-CoA hydratase-related protein [Thermodesulfobacteriota bacterium]|nr:enoyl-CoA hydratase-related protein [Thermodesulfobacteriota bacterium]